MQRTFDTVQATYQGDDVKVCKEFKAFAHKEYGSVSKAVKALVEKYLSEKKSCLP